MPTQRNALDNLLCKTSHIHASQDRLVPSRSRAPSLQSGGSVRDPGQPSELPQHDLPSSSSSCMCKLFDEVNMLSAPGPGHAICRMTHGQPLASLPGLGAAGSSHGSERSSHIEAWVRPHVGWLLVETLYWSHQPPRISPVLLSPTGHIHKVVPVFLKQTSRGLRTAARPVPITATTSPGAL